MTKPVHFTRGSRKHRIGRASARFVMANHDAEETTRPSGDTQLAWTGADERGRELHIIAIDLPDVILVIHVQPTSYEKET